MTDFIVTITDPEQLAGITWAREQHNQEFAPPVPPPQIDNTLPGEEPMPPQPPLEPIPPAAPQLETDQEYVQWVMEEAAKSYAVQQEQSAWRQAYLDAQEASTRRRQEAVVAEDTESVEKEEDASKDD